MKNKLHIIAFDIPFPANYGGAIDVFYRIKALSEQGIGIILHCFEYGNRTRQDELLSYCEKVYYYPRRKFVYEFWLPYIVSSRFNKNLLANLVLDDSPILFEALHSCYFLNHPLLRNRKKIVRMHNIEHDYYFLLSKSERHYFKKLYYLYESWVLKHFEKSLNFADIIYAISKKDFSDLSKNFGNKVRLMPAFHGNNEISTKLGKGNFCFYHGKLSVAENHEAAMYLVEKVFKQSNINLKIAGDGYSKSLKNAINKNPNIELLENQTPEDINHLIKNAHINVLPTFQPTGIKLKLVNVLFQGRFLVVNSQMVCKSGMEEATYISDDSKEMMQTIEKLMFQEFTEKELDKRREVLGKQFDNSANTADLIKEIFEKRES